MKWVKVDKDMPVKRKVIAIYKTEHSGTQLGWLSSSDGKNALFDFGINALMFYEGDDRINDIEWLDESESPQEG